MTVQETAEKWDVSLRWVQRLCKTERIDGAMYVGRVWLIPKNMEKPAYFKLGNLYFRQGLYKESEFFYKKALEMDDKNPNLYYSIGILYRQNKSLQPLENFCKSG